MQFLIIASHDPLVSLTTALYLREDLVSLFFFVKYSVTLEKKTINDTVINKLRLHESAIMCLVQSDTSG
jgi:hypothetical protein